MSRIIRVFRSGLNGISSAVLLYYRSTVVVVVVVGPLFCHKYNSEPTSIPLFIHNETFFCPSTFRHRAARGWQNKQLKTETDNSSTSKEEGVTSSSGTAARPGERYYCSCYVVMCPEGRGGGVKTAMIGAPATMLLEVYFV